MGTLDDHDGPWSEADFLALGEAHHRIELLDGSLLVTPSPNDHHQEIMGNLRDSLRPAARAVDLRAPQAPNIRLTTGRIPWYLLVEPASADYASVTLRLFRLDGTTYIEHAAAKFGETLITDEPFAMSISTSSLLDY